MAERNGQNSRVKPGYMKAAGFTLLELVAIVAILGVLTALVMPRVNSVLSEAKISKTGEKIMILKKAVSGDGAGVSGYENDVGALPVSLPDLLTKPAGVSAYDPYRKKGWNGPYLKETSPGDYLKDSWNNNFIYNSGARTITSYGADGASGGTGDNADITVSF